MIGPARLAEALEATWPAAEVAHLGGWRMRRGLGGGSRVSSVRSAGDPGLPLAEAIAEAERVAHGWNQNPLFQLTDADAALETALRARGYTVKDPTLFMSAPVAALAGLDPTPARPVEAEAPLAAMASVWALDGIGPARLAVMARAAGPKTFLAIRSGDAIGGVVFVAIDREVAMLHAMVVAPARRRGGLGRGGLIAAARFALRDGAETLALAVTEANAPARALYVEAGFEACGGYRYLAAPN